MLVQEAGCLDPPPVSPLCPSEAVCVEAWLLLAWLPPRRLLVAFRATSNSHGQWSHGHPAPTLPWSNL